MSILGEVHEVDSDDETVCQTNEEIDMPEHPKDVMDFKVAVQSTRKYKAGYEVRTEDHTPVFRDGTRGKSVTMRSAYTPDGYYIGNSVWGKRLVRDRGIKPELRTPSSNVCSIGFCEKDQKWFGWSHRAMYGFRVGDTVAEGDVTAEYLPIGFEAQSLDDARKMACAFARSIS